MVWRMKNLLIANLVLFGCSCNPYQPYYFTHYHIIASYDPASTSLSASVQMVFIPDQEYHDSITFQLNDKVDIHSLTAQELKYYEFDTGRLVLYIEDPVMPGEQLHISLNYSGVIGYEHTLYPDLDPGLTLDQEQVPDQQPVLDQQPAPDQQPVLDPALRWYPVNPDIDKLTYSVKIKLPDPYRLEDPGIRKRGIWHLITEKPLGSIFVPLAI
jgi:hypothetical protein